MAAKMTFNIGEKGGKLVQEGLDEFKVDELAGG